MKLRKKKLDTATLEDSQNFEENIEEPDSFVDPDYDENEIYENDLYQESGEAEDDLYQENDEAEDDLYQENSETEDDIYGENGGTEDGISEEDLYEDSDDMIDEYDDEVDDESEDADEINDKFIADQEEAAGEEAAGEEKPSEKKIKKAKIGSKMLGMILPIIIIAMILLTFISVNSGNGIINDQISERMTAELNVQESKVTNYFNKLTDIATTLASGVESTFPATEVSAYENMLIKIVSENDELIGSGIWFEPYVFGEEIQYVGPYAKKDFSVTKINTSYCTEDNPYVNQSYYLLAKEATGPVLTEPYYDLTAHKLKMSCVVPVHDSEDNFIGCVTVDMLLDDIKAFIDGIKVGEKGKATLLSEEGRYMAGASEKSIAKMLRITQEENKSLAKAGEKVLSNDSGHEQYTDSGKTYNIYYSTLDANGWKVMITIPESELVAPIKQMAFFLIIVCIIAVAVTAVFVIFGVSTIVRRLNSVRRFSGILASGDFTAEPLTIKSYDELGMMSESLNTMYHSNKEIINGITERSTEIEDSSRRLQDAAQELSEQFRLILEKMNDVNESMMTAGAATQQVNASTEEVLSNVNLLTSETDMSMQMVDEIKSRAEIVGNDSQKAYDSATELSRQFEQKLHITMENAKVVENIGELASVISNIADQIDLLSLNASIEAARAGEQGKGFAVVASEIGKLAGDTTKAVERIQNTIIDVQKAFDDLNHAANGILYFVKDTVTPDYDKFMDVAKQYGNDAESIAGISKNIADMSNSIRTIMTEVSDAIQSIAEASQNTADISNRITTAVEEVTVNAEEISDMSEDTNRISEQLNEVVGKFKI
ncbi:MAG: methyl-accepting chemotaxis protein [Lachnospiraceae bacterium]|nr:methyl-accepting chemotaxis protein [Lachnospiraceae bacterium]